MIEFPQRVVGYLIDPRALWTLLLAAFAGQEACSWSVVLDHLHQDLCYGLQKPGLPHRHQLSHDFAVRQSWIFVDSLRCAEKAGYR